MDLLNVVGVGSFGVIRKVRRRSDGVEIEYKLMSVEEKRQLVAEVNILRMLKHPNIVRYIERILDKKQCLIYIVMEYCLGGDLATVIKQSQVSKDFIQEDFIWSVLAQISSALNECHKLGILHRDIKPENLLMASDGETIKLSDFGLACLIDECSGREFSIVGTPYYMAPEVVSSIGFDLKTDVWSLGCVIHELCCLMPPFTAVTQEMLYACIQLGIFASIPKHYSTTMSDTIQRMLQTQLSNRSSVQELLELDRVFNVVKKRELDAREKLLDSWERKLAMKQASIDTFTCNNQENKQFSN